MADKKRALISVSDKRFVSKLARDLVKAGYEIVASSGTAAKLKEAGVPCKEISRVFKTSTLAGGRVKTIHPVVSAAILADREDAAQMRELRNEKVGTIDMVVANFYPFQEKVKPGKISVAEAIELIDIGGPMMVRAAAKNHKYVAVVCNIDQYKLVSNELKEHGEITPEFRLQLARDAFQFCQEYDAAIAAYFVHVAPEAAAEEVAADLALPDEVLPNQLDLSLKRLEKLRYGENPHQAGSRYSVKGLPFVPLRVLQGKGMSYNNYLDASAALSIISLDYPKPVVACVVKHLNPCGIAVGSDPLKTLINAREADPKSAFGGIVGINCEVDEGLARELKRTFFEIIIAPEFSAKAREVLSAKKNLRLIEASSEDCRSVQESSPRLSFTLFGAMLQGYDLVQETWAQLQVVTEAHPPETLHDDILLGLKFIRFLKSNSLCVVRKGVMVGAGSGQMSRVDATKIALDAAGRNTKDAVLVSDGFFPFADSIELAAKAKIACVVAPAGSKRDIEVVNEANKLKVPLIFAPNRHFLH